jgi:hypothetical protein
MTQEPRSRRPFEVGQFVPDPDTEETPIQADLGDFFTSVSGIPIADVGI